MKASRLVVCGNLGDDNLGRWNSVMPDGTMNPAGMNSNTSYGSVIEFV
jgi:hypothetical protein